MNCFSSVIAKKRISNNPDRFDRIPKVVRQLLGPVSNDHVGWTQVSNSGSAHHPEAVFSSPGRNRNRDLEHQIMDR